MQSLNRITEYIISCTNHAVIRHFIMHCIGITRLKIIYQQRKKSQTLDDFQTAQLFKIQITLSYYIIFLVIIKLRLHKRVFVF